MATKQEVIKANRAVNIITALVESSIAIWIFVLNIYTLCWFAKLYMWSEENPLSFSWQFPTMAIISLTTSLLWIAFLCGLYRMPKVSKFLSGITFLIIPWLLVGAFIFYPKFLTLTDAMGDSRFYWFPLLYFVSVICGSICITGCAMRALLPEQKLEG